MSLQSLFQEFHDEPKLKSAIKQIRGSQKANLPKSVGKYEALEKIWA